MRIYFGLQFKRFVRGLKDFGIHPYLGIFLMALAFVLVSMLLFNRISYAAYFYPVLALLWVYSLGNVKRNEFLKSIFTVGRYRKVRLLENVVLCVPFFLFLLVKRQYVPGLALLLCSGLCSFYNKAGLSGFVVPSPFSKNPFEFTVGFRKMIWLLLLLYVVVGIALWVDNFNLGMVALVGVVLVCVGFYAQPEPAFYVWIHAQSPGGFLKRKMRTAVFYGLCLCLPLAVALAVVYISHAWILLLIVVVGMLYVVLSVVSKYVVYPEQMDLLQLIKMVMGIVVPPLMLVLIPHFYMRSIKKLNAYLK